MATGTTFSDAKIEVSIDAGSNWTDISGQTNSLVPEGGDREIGTFFDAQNDTPTLGAGKRSPLDISVRVKYGETAGQGYDILESAYENKTEILVRWSPKGGQSGERLYTSDSGFVRTHKYPGQEVESGDPIRAEDVITVSKVTKSTIA